MSTLQGVRTVLIALLLLLGCDIAAAFTAGNVSSIRTTQLPPVPNDSQLIGLAVIDGRPVVIQSGGASILKTDRSGWSPADWRQPAANPLIRGVIGDGQRAFVLMGGGEPRDEVSRVARLEFDGDALRLRALSPLPVTLTSALGTTQGTAAAGTSPFQSNDQQGARRPPGAF